MHRLVGVPQHYAWGDEHTIPALLGAEPDGRPWAELWFGTHPGGPATLDDGRPLADVSGPLQQLRNTDAAWLNKQVSMADLKAQLHAYDLRVAAEELIKQICPAGFPDPHYFARREITKLIGLTQQSPGAYDGTV